MDNALGGCFCRNLEGVNDAQIWSIVAIMAAGLASMITLTTTLTFRYIGAKIDALDAKFSGRFDVVDERFIRMDERFDHLDRDMQRVIERVFPIN